MLDLYEYLRVRELRLIAETLWIKREIVRHEEELKKVQAAKDVLRG